MVLATGEKDSQKMKSIDGNLITLAIEGVFDVIIHGCNCFCSMDAGIAKQIKSEFPEAYEADCQTRSGDRSKLGTYSRVTVSRNNHSITIVNAYTQYHYAGTDTLLNYNALRQVFQRIKHDFPDQRIGIPRIGAGLAGGDWDTIAKIINDEMSDTNITLVTLKRSVS